MKRLLPPTRKACNPHKPGKSSEGFLAWIAGSSDCKCTPLFEICSLFVKLVHGFENYENSVPVLAPTRLLCMIHTFRSHILIIHIALEAEASSSIKCDMLVQLRHEVYEWLRDRSIANVAFIPDMRKHAIALFTRSTPGDP
jgi:hypothetical protein